MLSIIFLIFILNKKKLLIDTTIISLFFIQILISSVSIFTGINKNEALYGLLRNYFYLIVFIMVLNLEKENDEQVKSHVNMLNVLFYSGTYISIINIANLLFTIKTDGFSRFELVIPYANTLAVFLLLSSVAGFSLLKYSNNKPIIKAGIFIIALALIFSFSRAVWVIAIIIFSVYLIKQYSQELKTKSFLIKISGSLLLMIIIVLISGIGKELVLRIKSIGISAPELVVRFAYYKDALKIIKDYLLPGTGVGGWNSIQYQYQTVLYSTKYVHSSILQFGLDYGIWGIMVFLLNIIILFKYFIKINKKETSNMNSISVYAFLSCLIILVHSMFDIDFEFPVIPAWFWASMAMLSIYSNNATEISLKFTNIKRFKTILSGITLIIIIILTPVMISQFYYTAGNKAFEREKYNDAKQYFENAVKYNPIFADAYYMTGETLRTIYTKNNSGETLKSSITFYDKAQKLNKYYPIYSARKAYVYTTLQLYENAMEEYEKLISLQPLVIDYYEKLAEILMIKAKEYSNVGDKEKETKIYYKILDIEKDIINARKKIAPYSYKIKHNENIMEPSQSLLNNINMIKNKLP